MLKKSLFTLLTLALAGSTVLAQQNELDVSKFKQPMSPVTWNATGTKFLIYSQTGCEVYDQNGNQLHKLKGSVELATFSPDGNYISYVRRGEGVYVHSLLNGKKKKIVSLRNEQLIDKLDWSPTSDRLTYWTRKYDNPEFSDFEFRLVKIDGTGNKRIKHRRIARRKIKLHKNFKDKSKVKQALSQPSKWREYQKTMEEGR